MIGFRVFRVWGAAKSVLGVLVRTGKTSSYSSFVLRASSRGSTYTTTMKPGPPKKEKSRNNPATLILKRILFMQQLLTLSVLLSIRMRRIA